MGGDRWGYQRDIIRFVRLAGLGRWRRRECGVDRVVAAFAAREDGGAQDPREGTGVGQRGTAAAVGRDLRQPHRLHQEPGQGALIFFITKVDGHASMPGQLSSESFFVRRRFPQLARGSPKGAFRAFSDRFFCREGKSKI